MIKLISKTNIEQINIISGEILALIKAKKFYFERKYSGDVKLNAAASLLELYRAIQGDRFNKLASTNPADVDQLILLVLALGDLLLNKNKFMTFRLKDYSAEIKPKLCRELVSDLEDLYIMANIDRADIDDVYLSMSKPTPKKYAANDLTTEGEEVYRAISRAIKDKAQTIKDNSITHYIAMVNLIDPNDEIKTSKEFITVGRRKISDMGALKLCLACKFKSDKFIDLINDDFENLINIAANKITDHCNNGNKSPAISVADVRLGAKGFDIAMHFDSKHINARAIPVNGHFIRFHYRYIIT
jgi:hypothetical protein